MNEEAKRKVVRADVDRFGQPVERGNLSVDPLILSVERTRKWLVGLVIVLAALLVGIVFALIAAVRPLDVGVPGGSGTAEPMRWIQSIYGTGPAPEDLLVAPTSVAVGPSGDVFVAEPQRSRVVVFGDGGAFEREILSDGLERPESVTVDEFGSLYVADPAARAVHVFNAGGDPVRRFELDDTPRGVAVEGDEAYVLGQGRIYVFDIETGRELRWFGAFGTNPGELDAYQGIVVRGGNVYVADSLNKRIQAFDADGDLLWVSNGADSDSDAGAWQLPQDLAFDAAGRLVVVDALNFQLVVVDPTSGVALDRWGSFGKRDGAFSYPSSVAYDEGRDRFVVADTKNDRIQIVTLPGSAPAAQGLVAQAVSGPWKHLVVPAAAVAFAFLAWLGVRWMRKRRNPLVS